MLKQRVITAVLLLLVLIPAVFARQFEYFAAVMLLCVVAAGWEWMRLLKLNVVVQCLFCGALGMGCVVLWDGGFKPQVVKVICQVAVALWAVALAVCLPLARVPAVLLRAPGIGLHVAFAFIALLCAFAVVVSAKQISAVFVLTLMLLVWVADVAAYFTGKALGKHKLAPSISPGKTWEGAIGGMLGVGLLAVLCMSQPSSFFAALGDGSLAKVAALGLLLAAISIVGDLFESLLKRQAQVKDSSNLLPGHGGVLDRIDALLPMLPLAWLLL